MIPMRMIRIIMMMMMVMTMMVMMTTIISLTVHYSRISISISISISIRRSQRGAREATIAAAGRKRSRSLLLCLLIRALMDILTHWLLIWFDNLFFCLFVCFVMDSDVAIFFAVWRFVTELFLIVNLLGNSARLKLMKCSQYVPVKVSVVMLSYYLALYTSIYIRAREWSHQSINHQVIHTTHDNIFVEISWFHWNFFAGICPHHTLHYCTVKVGYCTMIDWLIIIIIHYSFLPFLVVLFKGLKNMKSGSDSFANPWMEFVIWFPSSSSFYWQSVHQAKAVYVKYLSIYLSM